MTTWNEDLFDTLADDPERPENPDWQAACDALAADHESLPGPPPQPDPPQWRLLKRRAPIEAMHACGHLELIESAPCSEQVKAEVRDRVAGTLCPVCRAAATRARQATEREAWRRQEAGEEAAPGWVTRETADERAARIRKERTLWD